MTKIDTDMEKEKFDFEKYKQEPVRKLLNKEPVASKDTLMKPLMKQILKAALEGELDSHMQEEHDVGNRRNGKSRKRVKSKEGPFV